MKRIVWFFVCVLFLSASACNESASKKVDQDKAAQSATETPAATTTMTFNKTVHDFGTIEEGETVQTTFTFTNTGQADLIIVDARGSCGCTVPNYLKHSHCSWCHREILVQFDSSNKPNMQQKTVTISANTSMDVRR